MPGEPVKETVERIRSVPLNNERTIWIREPVDPVRAKSLTVFLDAELYRDRVKAGEVIAALQGEVADSWFVFVSMHSVEARWIECPCHRPFAQFIAEELLPWLEQSHPRIGRVEQRVIVGLSYTGLAAAFVAREYPGLFQKVISQSGSFWWNDAWLTRQVSESGIRLPTEFYLEVGKRETQVNLQHREGVLQVMSQIEGVRRFRDVLVESGHTVVYAEFEGAHDYEAWRQTLPAALRWALPPR
jgi:enterochelin esterase-like enzyme